jgi:ATP adenylyltransferase
LLSKPKADDLKEATSSTDPFEKPNPALHISDLAEHRLLLNKFCVVPHHLLVVTKSELSVIDLSEECFSGIFNKPSCLN